MFQVVVEKRNIISTVAGADGVQLVKWDLRDPLSACDTIDQKQVSRVFKFALMMVAFHAYLLQKATNILQ